LKINVYGGHMEPTVKSVFKSKTLWINLILALVAFFPSVAEKLTPEVVMQAVAVVNMVLRFFTKDKVSLS